MEKPITMTKTSSPQRKVENDRKENSDNNDTNDNMKTTKMKNTEEHIQLQLAKKHPSTLTLKKMRSKLTELPTNPTLKQTFKYPVLY